MSPEVSVKESMEDRIKEFRSDPQKMDVTTKFVNEVVEKAKDEALKRMKEKHKRKQKEEERQKVRETNLLGGEDANVFPPVMGYVGLYPPKTPGGPPSRAPVDTGAGNSRMRRFYRHLAFRAAMLPLMKKQSSSDEWCSATRDR